MLKRVYLDILYCVIAAAMNVLSVSGAILPEVSDWK